MRILKKLDFSENEGRGFFVTDIHGEYNELQRLLSEVGFDESKDILLCGGDLMNRGGQSNKSIDYLVKPWFHSVAGNHDLLFIEHMRGNELWTKCLFSNGGKWVLDEPKFLLDAIYHELIKLPLALEVKLPENNLLGARTLGVVHAEVMYDNWDLLRNQNEIFNRETCDKKFLEYCVWERRKLELHEWGSVPKHVTGIDHVFVGHSAHPNKGKRKPLTIANVTYCDFGSGFSWGELKLIEVW